MTLLAPQTNQYSRISLLIVGCADTSSAAGGRELGTGNWELGPPPARPPTPPPADPPPRTVTGPAAPAPRPAPPHSPSRNATPRRPPGFVPLPATSSLPDRAGRTSTRPTRPRPRRSALRTGSHCPIARLDSPCHPPARGAPG